MRKLLTIMILISGSVLYAQESGLEQVRRLFLEAGKDSCKARELFQMLEKKQNKTPVFLAYEGVAEAMLAQCTKRNIEKMEVFVSGKRKLESALEQSPRDWEIRFLRFQLQVNIPAILAYNDFKSDKPFLLSSLPVVIEAETDKYYVSQVIEILILSDEFSREEVRFLRELKTKLNT